MSAMQEPDPPRASTSACPDGCNHSWDSHAFQEMMDPHCAACIDPSWLDNCQACEDAAADHTAGRASCTDESACTSCEVLPAPALPEMDEAALQELLACCCCPLPEAPPSPQRHWLCEWRGCNRYFHSQNDLASHVNTLHLGLPDLSTDASSRSSSLPPPTPMLSISPFQTVPDRCKWDDCQAEFPLSIDPSDRSESFLKHLTQDHLHSAPVVLTSIAVPTPSTSTSTPGPIKAEVVPGVHSCHWVGCQQVFGSSGELMAHVADDHVGSGKATYVCGWEGCARAEEGRVFTQRQKVLRHMQTHTGDKPFSCETCGKSFAESTTLAQHQRTHTRERPYECTECGKTFALASALTIHTRTHTGDKPFACPHPGCNSAFAESSNLRKHIRIHSGDRPFRCPHDGCVKAFQRSDQLNRHLKTHAGRK